MPQAQDGNADTVAKLIIVIEKATWLVWAELFFRQFPAEAYNQTIIRLSAKEQRPQPSLDCASETAQAAEMSEEFPPEIQEAADAILDVLEQLEPGTPQAVAMVEAMAVMLIRTGYQDDDVAAFLSAVSVALPARVRALRFEFSTKN